jgi:hypothetical protein
MPGRSFTPVRMLPASPPVQTTTDWSAYLALLPPQVPIAISGPTPGLPPEQVDGQSVTPSPTVVAPTLRQRLLPRIQPQRVVAPQPVYDVDNGGIQAAPSPHPTCRRPFPPFSHDNNPASWFPTPAVALPPAPPPVAPSSALYSPPPAGPAPGSAQGRAAGLPWGSAPRRALFTPPVGVQPPTIPPVTMMEASIVTVDLRDRSPVAFVDLCFLLGHNLPPTGDQFIYSESHTAVGEKDVILLRQPCPEARHILQTMSSSKSPCDQMHSLLQGRLLDRSMGAASQGHENLSFCTQAFVEKAFTMSRWAVSVQHPPMIGDSNFSPLCFNLAVHDSYPQHRIPAGSYSRSEAGVVGEIIFLFYSCLDLKYHQTGVSDNSFRQSLFGSFLHHLSQVPFMRQVNVVWQQYPEKCFLIWMVQIFDLFQMFKDLITFRRMSSTNGMQEIRVLTTGAQFLAGSSHVRGDYMNTRSNLAVSLLRLKEWVQNAWEIEALNPYSTFWTSPYSRSFFVDSPTGPTRPPPLNLKPGPSPEAPPHDTKRGCPAPSPFVAAQPALIFTPPITPGDTPFNMIHVAKLQTWPKMVDPSKGKHRNVCFACLFPPPFNQCSDTVECGTKTRKTLKGHARPGLQRIHLDLADPKWSTASYPPANWLPLIDFIKYNKDMVKPSDKLKQLTPRADWG